MQIIYYILLLVVKKNINSALNKNMCLVHAIHPPVPILIKKYTETITTTTRKHTNRFDFVFYNFCHEI